MTTYGLDLSGQTAIVTGAGRGIGREISLCFAEYGVNIVAAARTESELESTVSMVRDRDADGISVPTNLARVADIDELVDRTVEEYGVPTILVNNAGVNSTESSLGDGVDHLDRMADVNLRAPFLLSHRFAEAIRNEAGSHGRIINISSISREVGIPAMTFYGGTKAGVYGLTCGLAADLARDGITVNSVSAGLIEVERTRKLIEERDYIYNLDRIPLDRVGRPEDVANACLFLASDFAEYVTGEDIRVDGGVGITAGLYK